MQNKNKSLSTIIFRLVLLQNTKHAVKWKKLSKNRHTFIVYPTYDVLLTLNCKQQNRIAAVFDKKNIDKFQEKICFFLNKMWLEYITSSIKNIQLHQTVKLNEQVASVHMKRSSSIQKKLFDIVLFCFYFRLCRR